jgi:hypothetical protein
MVIVDDDLLLSTSVNPSYQREWSDGINLDGSPVSVDPV